MLSNLYPWETIQYMYMYGIWDVKVIKQGEMNNAEWLITGSRES